MPLKRALIIIIRVTGLLAAAWSALVIGLSGVYVFGLTHPGCPSSPEAPSGYQSIRVATREGVMLRGWWHPPENGVAVILMGGHGASRDTMLPEAAMLAQHGYGVLALDSRACDGELATMGAREVEDLRAGLSFALGQAGVQQVDVLGFSAGAVASILGAAEMPEISAVIAIGNYPNMGWEITNSGAPLSLEWQIERAVIGLIWLETGVWPPGVSPISALPRLSNRPVLLIHGELEARNNLAQEQYDAAGPPKQLWIVPGARHGEYLRVERAAFEQTVIDFLDRSRALKIR